MKMNRYRTIAAIYPYTSFEVEVETENHGIVYVNFSVENGEKVNLSNILDWGEWWSYTKPLDVVDVDEDDISLSDKENTEILTAMVSLWNENPIWDSTSEWRSIV